MNLHSDQVILFSEVDVDIKGSVPVRAGTVVPKIAYAKLSPPPLLRDDFCTSTDVRRSLDCAD